MRDLLKVRGAITIASGMLGAALLFAVPAQAAAPDQCVAANGEVRHEAGTATC